MVKFHIILKNPGDDYIDRVNNTYHLGLIFKSILNADKAEIDISSYDPEIGEIFTFIPYEDICIKRDGQTIDKVTSNLDDINRVLQKYEIYFSDNIKLSNNIPDYTIELLKIDQSNIIEFFNLRKTLIDQGRLDPQFEFKVEDH